FFFRNGVLRRGFAQRRACIALRPARAKPLRPIPPDAGGLVCYEPDTVGTAAAQISSFLALPPTRLSNRVAEPPRVVGRPSMLCPD
ncbi:MAG: hypothetical protein B7Z13_10035, partial [Caulobacterales bacterium 32-67-6]